ncbi:MAG: OmpA family protein [Actinomycetia bacterium]|nr:OmpA family protein [Actinomycetes bacterium]
MRDHDQPEDQVLGEVSGENQAEALVPAQPPSSPPSVTAPASTESPKADVVGANAPAANAGIEPEPDAPTAEVPAAEKLFDPEGLVVAGLNNPTPPPPPPSNTTRNVLIGVGGVLVVGLAVGIVAFNGSETRTTPEELMWDTPRARSITVTEVEQAGDESGEPFAFVATTTTLGGGQAGTGRSDDIDPEAPSVGELAADRTERLAVFKGGIVYLQGRVPSQEVADTIAARAAAVVGRDNVVVEYQIDPGAPLPVGAPLYVEDLVLFAYGSTDVGPEFLPLLEFGVSLFEQVPTVTIEVRGHTDASGPDDYNLALSQRRVDSVVDYWVGQGVDAERVTGVGFGETDLLDPASPDSKVNRRVEFIINGILG